MEKCNSCGTWNDDNTKFCRNCGKKLTTWGLYNEYTTTENKSNNNTTTQNNKIKSDWSTWAWRIIGAIVAALALGVI